MKVIGGSDECSVYLITIRWVVSANNFVSDSCRFSANDY